MDWDEYLREACDNSPGVNVGASLLSSRNAVLPHSDFENVPCRVHVSVKDERTARADMDALFKCFGNAIPTPGTVLARIRRRRVHFLATGTGSITLTEHRSCMYPIWMEKSYALFERLRALKSKPVTTLHLALCAGFPMVHT